MRASGSDGQAKVTLAQFESSNAGERISEITQAIQILAHSPLIGRKEVAKRSQRGRKVKDGKRILVWDLVIGRDARGCVALFRFVLPIDTVFVLALRSQPELGFPAGR